MRRQCGSLLLYGGLVLLLTVSLWGFYAYMAKQHYERGVADTMVKWQAANEKARQEDEARRLASEKIVQQERARREKLEQAARKYEQLWRVARNEAERNRVPLLASDCPRTPLAGRADRGAGDDAGGSVTVPRFTWAFVGLYDGVWTSGQTAQPLFGHPATIPPAGASAAAPSPYGPGEVLDTHAENARRFDTCRRDLNALIDTVERLRTQWDAR